MGFIVAAGIIHGHGGETNTCRMMLRALNPPPPPPGQNGRRLADDIFKDHFMNEKLCILIRITLKFVPKGSIGNKPSLVQAMAWRRPGHKPFPETLLTQFPDAYKRP